MVRQNYLFLIFKYKNVLLLNTLCFIFALVKKQTFVIHPVFPENDR